ncbi:Histidine kinase-, DNA gyrase B-, and HSP90-like ATPase [Micromonospora haikouensis]|uniref:histidine kinase n=1 Tax=Micromonospora haikouensis TaxID=686309 RepID=A0A1C4WWN9_9ACTN|nr:ATP-binding protein [Micromonospora haikouensis]SCF00598.1 Histidine kinase-, DNA gyrase B-, and HSP90-like ATPase [Micromonospora haikouensis]
MVLAPVLRQWPLVVLLVVLALLDVQFSRELDTAGRGWMAPGIVVVAATALLARARPVAAALGVAATLVVSSVLLRAVGAEMPGGLAMTEIAALAVIIVAVVRQVPGIAAAGLIGLMLVTGLTATQLRPQYWSLPEGAAPEPWWSVSLWEIAMVVLPVAYGWYLRGRDRQRARASRAAVIAAQQRERLGLARELRDVVAHQVGAMMEQARAAQALTATDSGAAARALPVIERSGIEALSAMRRMVATLREGEQGAGVTSAPLARTTDLAADLRAITSAGSPPVRLTVDLAEPVADEVATSVLRLVQESVANARRHAGRAREIVASVWTEEGNVRIDVHDDGRSTPTSGSRRGGGFGLIGMRERVRLLGGRFTAGRTTGGWRVTADVPLRRAER